MATDIWGVEYDPETTKASPADRTVPIGAPIPDGPSPAPEPQTGPAVEPDAPAEPPAEPVPSREELEREVHGLDTGDPLTAQVVGALERHPATFEENPALVHAVLILASRVEVMDKHLSEERQERRAAAGAVPEPRREEAVPAARRSVMPWAVAIGAAIAGAVLVAVALASGGSLPA